jgi:hypothetical protein
MYRSPSITFADFVGVYSIEPRTMWIRAKGIVISQWGRKATTVPFLAARRAGLTADAGVKIDDEAKLLIRRCGECCHGFIPEAATANPETERMLAAGGRTSRSKRGTVSRASLPAFSMLTRRSYQAACPVIGSLLEKR